MTEINIEVKWFPIKHQYLNTAARISAMLDRSILIVVHHFFVVGPSQGDAVILQPDVHFATSRCLGEHKYNRQKRAIKLADDNTKSVQSRVLERFVLFADTTLRKAALLAVGSLVTRSSGSRWCFLKAAGTRGTR
jgi:hypothetical protein